MTETGLNTGSIPSLQLETRVWGQTKQMFQHWTALHGESIEPPRSLPTYWVRPNETGKWKVTDCTGWLFMYTMCSLPTLQEHSIVDGTEVGCVRRLLLHLSVLSWTSSPLCKTLFQYLHSLIDLPMFSKRLASVVWSLAPLCFWWTDDPSEAALRDISIRFKTKQLLWRSDRPSSRPLPMISVQVLWSKKRRSKPKRRRK